MHLARIVKGLARRERLGITTCPDGSVCSAYLKEARLCLELERPWFLIQEGEEEGVEETGGETPAGPPHMLCGDSRGERCRRRARSAAALHRLRSLRSLVLIVSKLADRGFYILYNKRNGGIYACGGFYVTYVT